MVWWDKELFFNRRCTPMKAKPVIPTEHSFIVRRGILSVMPYYNASKIPLKSVRNDKVKNWHNKPQAAIPTEQTRRLGRLHLPNN